MQMEENWRHFRPITTTLPTTKFSRGRMSQGKRTLHQLMASHIHNEQLHFLPAASVIAKNPAFGGDCRGTQPGRASGPGRAAYVIGFSLPWRGVGCVFGGCFSGGRFFGALLVGVGGIRVVASHEDNSWSSPFQSHIGHHTSLVPSHHTTTFLPVPVLPSPTSLLQSQSLAFYVSRPCPVD